MKIFISWSGQLSKNLAEVFRQWLPGVIQAVKPYYSPDDISKGSRWNTEISQELDSSKVGIICLTKENLEAPWIMFEAGALSKNIDKSKLCPILFEVEPSEIEGPLVQFQAAKFSKDEIRKLMKMINSELGENSLAPDVLDNVLEMWWPILKEKVDKVLKDTIIDKKKTSRSERDILEEILELTRSSLIQRDRLRGDVHISIGAIRDLIESYLKLVNEVESFAGVLNTIGLIDAIHGFEKPLFYLLRRSDISGDERDSFINAFETSKSKLDKIFEYTLAENNIKTEPKIEEIKAGRFKRTK
jgi:hypothetical protein